MEEMVGGCSVCSDDTGWTENPLVYCDGPMCNVAVHQACYGIRKIPKGKWFCRKCEAFKDKSVKVKCELCPSKDGALKPTENGNWAHVVCALYIPEVTFMDVTTMEPVKLSAIPRERFNRLCYICKKKNKGAKVTYGACMSCNKLGCKLSFHVTCAQSAGLLCEVAANHYDNLKYVGYCMQHYSKLKKRSNIRIIAPYRPQNPLENSSSNSTHEKQLSLNINNIDPQTSKPMRKLTNNNRLGDKITHENIFKDSTTSNTLSGDQRKSGPHIVAANHQSENLNLISTGATFENKKSTSKKQCFEGSEIEVKQTAKYQKNKNTMNTVKCEDDQCSNGLKIIKDIPELIKSNIAAKMDAMIKECKLKEKPSVINSVSMDNKQEEFKSRTSVPHMLGNSLNPTSSMAQEMADIFDEEIETHKIFDNEPNLSTNTQMNVLVGPQLPRRRQRPQEIGDSEDGFNVNDDLLLEAILERQWQQDRESYMEQAQHFDIASLIACMYQLKNVENVALEEELDAITNRRDHLQDLCDQLAIPLAPQNSRNQAPAPPVTKNYKEDPMLPYRSNFQPDIGNIDSSFQNVYQNHSMPNRRTAQPLSNNIASQVVIRGGVVHDSRSDNRSQVNQNQRVLNSNPMCQASTQQSANLRCHKMGMDAQPKQS